MFRRWAPKNDDPRCEPFGRQPHYSRDRFAGGLLFLRLLASNMNGRPSISFAVPIQEIVVAKREHYVQMPTVFRTKRGVPPTMGSAKMEEGVAGSAD